MAVLVILIAFICSASVRFRCLPLLAQASSCRIHRVADGFARREKFQSSVLLPSRRQTGQPAESGVALEPCLAAMSD